MDFLKQNYWCLHRVASAKWWLIAFAFAVILVSGYRLFLSPPANFPSGSIIIISQGTSAFDAAKELADAHVIAHPSHLRFILRLSGRSDRIQTGAYRFETPQNLLVIAYRLIVGEYDLPLVRITFPEGTTIRGVAAQITNAFPEIPASDFISAGKLYEGYLFPDTYSFPPGTDLVSIVKAMRTNFNSKIAALSVDIRASGHSLSEIVILASLIEKEARTNEDKHIVAGILLNRLALGMPLQVDAARDTYEHTGLPSKPICNPGLESINAILHPTKTDYLYYLTGRDDLMHYATTFAGHQSNRRKYLD